MSFNFEIVETAAATAAVKENAFVSMLGDMESPFKTLELGKSIMFDVPASNPEEIKAAEKIKKDLGEHIRHVRPEFSPRVQTRDENGKRHFVATITEKIKRDRSKGDEKPAETPAEKPAEKVADAPVSKPHPNAKAAGTPAKK